MGMLADLDRFLTRTFNPGSLAVDASTRSFGIDTEQWSPQEYGEYIATSNAVYTVVKKRATYLASLPLTLARLKGNGEADPVTKGAAYELTRKVNPYWTWRRLIEMTEMSLCLWGAAYWFLERGNGSAPRELYWARPDRVTVVPHPTEYVDRFEYRPVAGQEPIRFTPSETIWFRYPNPLDEYSGLSPLAAARLAADTQSAAMKQNFNLFKNGISIGGLVTPGGNTPLNKDAAQEIKDQLRDRAKGTANAHRWLVLLHDAKFQPMTLSPRDAEFVGLHKLTLEDICRPYGVPLDLVGGERTYANLHDAKVMMWTDCIIPEASFLADEITEQLLPMFAGTERVDVAAFDHSHVEDLQEDEEAKWRIDEGQIRSGRKTINEIRKAAKEEPLPWGDAWWGSMALVPITDAELPEPEPALPLAPGPQDDPPKALPAGDEPDDELERGLRALMGNGRHGPALPAHIRVAYDSEEHQRLFRLFVRRTERHEEKVKKVARELFRQQQQALLTELGKVERAGKETPQVFENMPFFLGYDKDPALRAANPDDADSLMAQIFNMARWRKRFRAAMKPVLTLIALDGGQAALDEVTVGIGFDVSDPNVARFLERRAQRFATRVNGTTWDLLKASIAEGLDAGEGTDVLKERVRAVMGGRIRSSAEVIARTETTGAFVGASLEGYRQSGVVEGVSWLSALDDRTRSSHVDAHGQVVTLGEDFRVGDGRGPGPGLIDRVEEVANCRCSVLAVLKP